MPDTVILPHPHILLRGGFVRIVDAESDWISGLLHGLKDNGRYTYGFDGLRHRCNLAGSTLKDLGIPESYWDGITFYAYSRGPVPPTKGKKKSRYGFNSFVGIASKVQRRDGEWVLIDAFKTPLAVTQTSDPVFNRDSFTAEQWDQTTDFSDDYYSRRPNIKFTVTK